MLRRYDSTPRRIERRKAFYSNQAKAASA